MRHDRRIRFALLLTTGIAALALAVSQATAVPEPDIVQRSWQFEIKYDTPRAIVLDVAGYEGPTVWWYWTYTVTNKTGEDQNFVPEIVMKTDAGDVVRANSNVPPSVYQGIRKALRNPLLRSPTEVIGRLLQGEDNAVDGIAIWAMPKKDINEVSIFFQGLSGETHEVKNPETGESVTLKKALMVQYRTPGSAERQELKPWLFKDETWVVR